MGFARSRSLTVTADGANNQTPWISAKKGLVATLRGTFVGTATLQRRGADGNAVDVLSGGSPVTYTAAGAVPFNTNFVQGEYRLNMKSGAYTSGTCIMSLEAA